MWYFTWILGLGLAVGFGILNGVWYEFNLTGCLVDFHGPTAATNAIPTTT